MHVCTELFIIPFGVSEFYTKEPLCTKETIKTNAIKKEGIEKQMKFYLHNLQVFYVRTLVDTICIVVTVHFLPDSSHATKHDTMDFL